MNKQFLKLTARAAPRSQWNAISSFFNRPAARLKRRIKLDLRQIMNALLFIVRTGCQWRNLPSLWPDWQAVYYYGSGHLV
ncbi:transposase [Dyadobacter pollutisoli]|uniref:transposase n=1 Tax=Dyadobacter pollutisoli TaxID=2910158 RepID=UPI0035B6732F